MKKFIVGIFLFAFLVPLTTVSADASLISDRKYRIEQKRINKQNIKKIRDLLELHNKYANEHNRDKLAQLYADSYINNDGFNKEAYFKNIDVTWEACEDLVYDTEILSIDINGDNASVNVFEVASGTISDTVDAVPIAGEIHSKAKGIYHLVNINGNWYISAETSLTDESSLLYGDARFMNIEIQTPAQVAAGETYTVTLKVDADDDTFIIGSIDHDPVKFPSKTPKSELRALPQSHILERLIKANSDNVNEYAVGSLAISKVQRYKNEDVRIYMAGLACVMKRINVIPKNKFIKIEE